MNKDAFDFFDKIFCLNLQHRTDRWENCVKVFNELGLQDRVERIEGYNAIKEYTDNSVFAKYFEHGPNNIDVINLRRTGCAYSFIKLIIHAKEQKFKNILIFEDDVCLTAPSRFIKEYLNEGVLQLPQDWEMFYLSANPTVCPREYSSNLCYLPGAYCCHAVAISERVYDHIITSYNNEEDAFGWVLKHVNFDTFCTNNILPRDKSYMLKHLLFTQYSNFSDIENCIRPNDDVIKQTYMKFSHILSV